MADGPGDFCIRCDRPRPRDGGQKSGYYTGQASCSCFPYESDEYDSWWEAQGRQKFWQFFRSKYLALKRECCLCFQCVAEELHGRGCEFDHFFDRNKEFLDWPGGSVLEGCDFDHLAPKPDIVAYRSIVCPHIACNCETNPGT